MSEHKWTQEEIDIHIRNNCKNEYSAMVVIAGLHKKLYGTFPKIGMSGEQGECAEFVYSKLPDAEAK